MFRVLSKFKQAITIVKPIQVAFVDKNIPRIVNNIRLPVPLLNNFKQYNWLPPTILSLSLLRWLGFDDDDENKESELIMTLKRAVLCSRREQYAKAEQLLHIALRLAQQQQNEKGITYCYDLMANVAFDDYELAKAEKLFVSLLQRLLAEGYSQDDLKVIHISLKLARISHLLAQEEKAEIGYKWCLEQIEKKKGLSSDALVLYGVVRDWYAQFLLDRKDVKTSLTHLEEAYKVCCEVKGKTSEQSMLLLNDLGITSWRAGDLDKALEFLTEAVAISNEIPDKIHVGVVHANLGLVYLEKGMTKEAEKYCRAGWHIGRSQENAESVGQANYCFDQIKIMLEKPSETST